MTRVVDRAFAAGVAALALLVPITLAVITLLIVIDARQSLTTFGSSYFTTTVWDPVTLVFGAAAYVYGTLVTTAIAVIVAVPIAVGAAIYLTEFAPRVLRAPVAFVIELLAYIPSIVYGLWGLFVLVPIMRNQVEPALQSMFSGVPLLSRLFSGTPVGLDLLTGGVILAIMILPILLAVSREVLLAVPPTQREAMIGLGATHWEAVSRAVLPYARPGIIGAAVLGVARAFGETMAVTLVVGNSSREINGSLLVPGYTMASAIANQFTEADSELYFSAIVEIALALLLVALAINTLARLLIRRAVADRPAGVVI
ncbi:MAG TPA: phosphate ABC transporter permease subunit PstC [Candidatus Limnocylindria bacterium]|nr:phosphate ABC transporter permease subunit PstC [Candidatus Limnocylindria bacterium]